MKNTEITNKYLSEFLEYSKNLTELYHISRTEFDPNWIAVKSSISNSIISIYKFSNELFKDDKFDKKDVRYYTFYIDMVLSKLRHSLFTETPKRSFVDIHTFSSQEIVSIGQILLDKQTIDDEFDIDFHRFIFKIFLMYDFIFYEDDGVFTRFDLNKNLFSKISKDLLAFNNGKKNSFRDYGKDIIENILRTTLDVKDKRIYGSYIKKSKKETILIEPFSYYLGFKIWKTAKIIQSTFEFLNEDELLNEKEKFKEYFKNIYLEQSKQAIENFYDAKITNRELFKSISTIDKEFLDGYVLKLLLPKYKQKAFCLAQNNIKTNKIKKIFEKNAIKNMINKMISNTEHDRFKFYRVLEDKDTTVEDISLLVALLASKIEKTENVEIIGMLRSGVLLAHCINISKGINQPVYMFSSFPYISLLPRTNLSSNQNVFIIDESIKSAFSTVLANIYKQRSMYLNGDSIYNYKSSVYTLVDFVDFTKNNEELSCNSLVDIKAKNGNISCSTDMILSEEEIEIFDWKSYFRSLAKPKIDYKDIVVDINGSKRLDITRVLANSHLLFTIAKKFAEKLDDIEDEEMILFASTDEGKLIVDSVIFAYKALYPEKQKTFILNKAKAQERLDSIKLIFVDMSIDTMHTLERSLEIDFDGTIDDMFYSFTILASDTAKETLKDKILFIDDLHKEDYDA